MQFMRQARFALIVVLDASMLSKLAGINAHYRSDTTMPPQSIHYLNTLINEHWTVERKPVISIAKYQSPQHEHNAPSLRHVNDQKLELVVSILFA